MILQAESLTIHYAGAPTPALSEVSLGITPGSLLVLGGPNGSGKTTLLRALLGVLSPSTGSVSIDGRAVASWPRRELARRVGVVSQREEVWVPLSVEEVVTMGRYAHLGPLTPIRPPDRAVIEQVLQRCDVVELRTRKAETLSGGEWQRVRIARALAQEPQALVLDEPGNALDVRHEMEVMELIRTLVDDGMACLLITHHLNLASRYADRIVLLDKGRIVAEGTPTDVLQEEILTRVFGWPIAVTPWRAGSPQFIPLRSGEGAGEP